MPFALLVERIGLPYLAANNGKRDSLSGLLDSLEEI